jgi:hypothetical protein
MANLRIYEEIETRAREVHSRIALDEKLDTPRQKSKAFIKHLEYVGIDTITPFQFLLNFNKATNATWHSADLTADADGGGYLALDTLLRLAVEALAQDRRDAIGHLESVIAKAEAQLLWAEERGYKRRRLTATTSSAPP